MALNTMYPAKANSPQTTLAADITASATTVAVSDGTVLPDGPNLCTLGDDDSAEVVMYTTKSGNTLTGCVRGVSGTTASIWAAGTVVAREFTSYDHDTFIDNINGLDSGKQDTLTFDAAPESGSANPVTCGGIYTALSAKAPLNSPTLGGTPRATTPSVGVTGNRIATADYVWAHHNFVISGSISAGSTATFTDSRIDSDSWEVAEIYYGTPANVTTGTTWTTDSEAHTVTLGATFTGSTTVEIVMRLMQQGA